MDVRWDPVRSLRCVGSAAFSLSTKSHPLESRIGLHQLVLFLRQGLISLLVSVHLENILIILLFYFSRVLKLLISYLSCLICGQLPVFESVRTLWTVGKATDPNLSLGEMLCQMWNSCDNSQSQVVFKRVVEGMFWQKEIISFQSEKWWCKSARLKKEISRESWENSEQFELQVWAAL